MAANQPRGELHRGKTNGDEKNHFSPLTPSAWGLPIRTKISRPGL
jgi:hypothetical protein